MIAPLLFPAEPAPEETDGCRHCGEDPCLCGLPAFEAKVCEVYEDDLRPWETDRHAFCGELHGEEAAS